MPRPASPAPSRLIWAAAISGLALLSLHAELFGREVADVDQRASWAQRSLAVSERRGDSIKVTKAPYRLPGFLYDAAIPAGQETELSDLFPRQVRKLGGLLNHSAFRLKVGEPGERYQLNIKWASAAGSHLTIALYDAQSRPRARWSGDHGQGSLTNVDGSVYQLVVSADGPLGDHFRLSAQAQEMPHRETRNSAPTPQFDEVPVLHLTMSPANRVLWESMRRVALSKMNPIGIPVDTPNRRVTATIKADGGVSRARIWLAGQGDPAHMDVRWPSFTVSLQAGALFRGFARFKLYNIVTQNGILDYTVASLLEDEGLFVPRKQLVNVVFNGSDLGLYIIEELAKTQGHFENHRRYDGRFSSSPEAYIWVTMSQPPTNSPST